MYVIRYVDIEGGWYAVGAEARVRTSETATRFPTWRSAEQVVDDEDLEGVLVERAKT